MSPTIQFWFDPSTTFLQAMLAISVFLVGLQRVHYSTWRLVAGLLVSCINHATNHLSTCKGCLWLSQKVTELEKRVSLLCQIGEDKQFIDTMLAQGSNTKTPAGGDLDDTNAAQPPDKDQWIRLEPRQNPDRQKMRSQSLFSFVSQNTPNTQRDMEEEFPKFPLLCHQTAQCFTISQL